MEITVTIAKVTVAKVMFFVFCSDCNSSNGKVNKQRTIYGKLVGNGSVMENHARCGSSCNNHNIGDIELAPIHQCNVGMYSVNSHTCLWKRTCMTSFVLPSCGSGVLTETKGY